MIKDIEFILKKIFLSEKYLLKKRLKRAIHNNYEKELKIIEKFADKTNDALDIGYIEVYILINCRNILKWCMLLSLIPYYILI